MNEMFFCRLDDPCIQMFLRQFRLSTIPLDWSASGGRIYHRCRLPIKLSRKYKGAREHCLAACVIRKSALRNAGNGVFLAESVTQGQILLKYGGRRVSFPEANRLKQLVCSSL